MIKRLLLLVLIAVALHAADYAPGFLANGTTTVTSADARIYGIGVQLISGSSATVTIKDKSTLCSGGACSLVVMALTTASPNAFGQLNGYLATGGFTVTADCGSCVTGWVGWGSK